MDNKAIKDEAMEMDFEPQAQTQPHHWQAEGLVGQASLLHAFEKQQQCLREAVQNEFDKRLPLATHAASSCSGVAKQASDVHNPPSQPQHDHDQYVINTLLVKNNELHQRNDSFQAAYNTLSQDYSLLKAQHDSTRGSLDQERLRSAALESKMQNLRSMLIPANETQLSDGEVVSKFTSLRSQILKLVKTTWRRDRFKSNFKITASHERILRPYIDGKVSMKYLDNWLRGVVFFHLKAYIFDLRTFSLAGKNVGLDDGLGKFETLMWEELPRERHSTIIDWRVATMKATASLRKDKYRPSRAAQCVVWKFFDIFETRSDKSAADGKRLLEKICHDTVDLSLMVRNAKDEYLISGIEGGIVGKPISEWEEYVEEEASQPPRSQHPETVAYLTHGILAKSPNGNSKDRKVLERGQAVVYR